MTTPRNNSFQVWAYLLAEVLSQIGNFMSNVAIPWFVLETTKSPILTGVAFATTILAELAGATFLGPLVDRVGGWRSSVYSDVVTGLCRAAVPILFALHALPFALFLVLLVLTMLIEAPGASGRDSMVPVLAERAGWPVSQVVAAKISTMRIGLLAGPLISGVLIALVGVSQVLWIDAITYFCSAALVALFVPFVAGTLQASPAGASSADDSQASDSSEPDLVPAKARSGYFVELREGFDFFAQRPQFLWVGLAFVITQFTLNPMLFVVFPILASTVLRDPIAQGALISSWGVGSLLSSLAFAAFTSKWPRKTLFELAYALAATALGLFLFGPNLLLMCLLTGLAALGIGAIRPALTTTLSEQAPAALRGRVFALFTAVISASIPLGSLVLGSVSQLLGLQVALVIIFVGTVLSLLIVLFVPNQFGDEQAETTA